MKLLIVASTFPATDTDPVPAFVKDQIVALKRLDPSLEITVLAPYDARSRTARYTTHAAYSEYRFHYFWPRQFEKLAGRGILPQLKQNPLYYMMIPFLFLGEFFALWRLTRRLKPDVLYAHWFTPQGIVAGMVSHITKVPYVITTHAADVAVWKNLPFGKKIVQHYTFTAKAITAVSPRTLEKLCYFFDDQQWNQLKGKVQIIPMGVFLPDEPPAPAKKGQNILFVGRLAEKKGVRYLLEAFAKVATDFPTASLTVAGDGPLLNDLKELADRLEIPKNRLDFAGYISGEAKQKYLAQANIYVIPSIITKDGDAEGLPVTFMEGLAAGKICIATNESGADNIIEDRESGFLVPQKDVEALVDALEKALNLSNKDRQRLQKNAITTAKQFDWQSVAEAHVNFLFKNDRMDTYEGTHNK